MIRDDKAFIIQVDDRKIFKVRNAGSANYYYSSLTLEIGDDIRIADNCN
jgi:hypothetical protein